MLPAGEAVLVVHSGTIRAVLAIALDLAPDSALRFVIDPLSLTRIDRLENGWRVVAVNTRWLSPYEVGKATCAHRSELGQDGHRAMRFSRPDQVYPFRRAPRSVGRPMPAASKPPSTARICPVM